MKLKANPKNIVFVIGVLALIALLFTPFYGIPYLVIVYGLARQLTYSKIFNSLFSRFILAGVIFGTLIMIVGTISWLLHISIHPLFLALVSIGLSILINKLSKTKESPVPLFNKGDVISVTLAVILIPIIALSFYFPKPSDASSLQILANGYDNAAHLSLVRTTADDKGYVYGYQNEVKSKTITDLNAYPQGWHLTASHLMNSFGLNFFKSSTPILAINGYLISLAITYVVAIFLATKIMWRLYQQYSGEKDESLDAVLVFVVANLLIQLLIYWGSLLLGFASFIACLAYITVIISAVIDTSKNSYMVAILVSCLAAFATVQTWLLPLPAVFLTMLIAYGPKVKELLVSKKKNDRKYLLQIITFAGIAALGGIFQLAILLKFNPVDSVSALNDDGGIFWISNLIFGAIVLLSIFYWRNQHTDKLISDKFIASVSPFLLLSGTIFIYQMLSMDKTSYYFVKSIGIAVCVVGIFFVPAFLATVIKMTRGSKMIFVNSIVAITVIAVLMVSTGQNTLALSGFKQGNSKITTELAVAIEGYLRSNDVRKTHLMVLRDINTVEESVGTYFANRTAHLPDICESDLSLDFIAYARTPSLREKVNRFKQCLDNNESTVVITSNKSINEIRSLNDPRIIIVNVP